MTKFTHPLLTALIISFLLITTCTTDNSITGNPNKNLSKVVSDSTWIPNHNYNAQNNSDNCALSMRRPEPKGWWVKNKATTINSSYDLRDNYLSKSEKGKDYTECYYELSRYGLENDLINKYYNEHFELFINSAKIAHDLQHGNNDDQILINKEASDALNDMLKVYRDSPNHMEIKPVLDYLEADLEKYSNKAKYEIALDFK